MCVCVFGKHIKTKRKKRKEPALYVSLEWEGGFRRGTAFLL